MIVGLFGRRGVAAGILDGHERLTVTGLYPCAKHGGFGVFGIVDDELLAGNFHEMKNMVTTQGSFLGYWGGVQKTPSESRRNRSTLRCRDSAEDMISVRL